MDQDKLKALSAQFPTEQLKNEAIETFNKCASI